MRTFKIYFHKDAGLLAFNVVANRIAKDYYGCDDYSHIDFPTRIGFDIGYNWSYMEITIDQPGVSDHAAAQDLANTLRGCPHFQYITQGK